ncbi:hypothetical protein K8Z49_22230 [Actinomadura madurae]|uniref:Uncharacterized protein n=1 Tax=Actinomadura madurae TaxID=1993 RepID=A0A1I5GB73_9ACTN|nr:hypothetical protein [Actinomadura madurae]SFO32771.1 hypothetical protein SAMN04489713_105102 [Actinomadura madurae]
MSDLPPPWDPGAPPSRPGAPPAFPDAVELPPSTPSYAHWTREPLIYFWVLLRGRRIGCLWGSPRHQAAGFLLVPDVSEAEMYAADVWEDRLAEAYARDMQAAEAVRRWKGAAEDQVGGAIPADEEERRAPSLQALHEVVAPGYPAPEGPSVQDGLFEDGTPADRSQGFGPLFSAPPPTYPEEAAGPVRSLPVTLAGTVVGYVWASADGQAAGYVSREPAGTAGEVAAGLWKMRLSDAHREGVSSLEALRRCALAPEDRLSGVIGQDAPEQELPGLDALRELARQ